MRKNIFSAMISCSVYLLMPDVMNKPQTVLSLMILFMTAWSVITYFEEQLNQKRRRNKRRHKKVVPIDDYVLWERYADGTLHKVPMPK